MITATRSMIREARLEDVAAVVAMGQAFLRGTNYGAQLPESPDALADLATRLITNPESVVLLAIRDDEPVGMLALWAYPHPMSGERVASELVWWVNQEARGSAGVRLLRRGELWAKAQGAAVLTMIAPAGEERVGDFYTACGFEPVEMSYSRRL